MPSLPELFTINEMRPSTNSCSEPFLQPRIAKHLDRLDNDFIREYQSVTPLEQGLQHLPPYGGTTRMRANKNSRIENDSQPIGPPSKAEWGSFVLMKDVDGNTIRLSST